MKGMKYQVNLSKFIWYHEADSTDDNVNEPEVLELYDDLIITGTQGKLNLEQKVKKSVMRTLEIQKFENKASLNNKLLQQLINKDIASGHMIHE